MKLITVLCSIVWIGAIASPAIAGKMHAKATISAANGSSTAGECKKHSGIAHVEKSASTAAGNVTVVAHEQDGLNYVHVTVPAAAAAVGWGASGHAHHHNGNFCVGILSATDDAPRGVMEEQLRVRPQGFALDASQTYTAGDLRNTVDIVLSPSTFLRVDTSALASGKSMMASWTLTISGESSTVALIVSKQRGRISVMPLVTGVLFSGKAFTIVPMGRQVHVLRFVSPLQWTVPGDVETINVLIEGAVTSRARRLAPLPLTASDFDFTSQCGPSQGSTLPSCQSLQLEEGVSH